MKRAGRQGECALIRDEGRCIFLLRVVWTRSSVTKSGSNTLLPSSVVLSKSVLRVFIGVFSVLESTSYK